MAGYSTTPLEKKLGIKEGFQIDVIGAPPYYSELFESFPAVAEADAGAPKDFIHLFTKSEKELAELMPALRAQLKPAGMLWVSWPKKASKVPTDITEDTIRKHAFQYGMVDIKVCAVDQTWSGLKLVIRLKKR